MAADSSALVTPGAVQPAVPIELSGSVGRGLRCRAWATLQATTTR